MSFYLVQRLAKAWDDNTKEGFDHFFELEYMGSAEYEFRTPNEALKRMRAKPLIAFHHELHSVGGVALPEPQHVFFIGHKDELLDKVTAHATWLDAERERCKERTYFRENVTGLDWRGEPISHYEKRTIAWWSYTDDIAWTLDPDVAVLLLRAFAPK